jgi:serine/threonine-protein kinase RsbW
MLSASVMFRVTADLAALTAIRHFVAATGMSFGLEDEIVVDIVQAVDEAVTNIVMHGYRHNPGPVEIEMVCEAGDLIVRLSDQAPPFDPTTVPAPKFASHIEPGPGGWGIQMMRSLTDRMSYRALAAGGNELTLVKAVQAPTPQEFSV